MTGPTRKSVVVVTMVRDEASLLPRWIAYYGGQFGVDRLLVVDDATADGSTDDLPCSVVRLPDRRFTRQEQAARDGFAQHRARFVNDLAAGLGLYHDVVVYSDVDEFLVPLPEAHGSLAEYVERCDEPVVAAVGLNLVHNLDVEPGFDESQGILEQRRHVKFVANMCKPLIAQQPLRWSHGFHGCNRPYRVDPTLLQVHVKFMDRERALANQRVRHDQYRTGRGGPRSTWRIPADDLAGQLDEWLRPRGPVAPLDTSRLDLDVVSRSDATQAYGSAGGTQLQSMRDGPMFRLPESLRHQF